MRAIATLGTVLLTSVLVLTQGRGPSGGTVVLEQAPKDRSVAIPKDKLAQYLKDMDAKKLQTLRMIEGGKYNVAGGATVNTGYQVKDGERVPNTGVAVATKPGDVFFHPSNFYHGFSEVTPDIFWLNIRWDDNYAK